MISCENNAVQSLNSQSTFLNSTLAGKHNNELPLDVQHNRYSRGMETSTAESPTIAEVTVTERYDLGH